jgi:hypothetical protein
MEFMEFMFVLEGISLRYVFSPTMKFMGVMGFMNI